MEQNAKAGDAAVRGKRSRWDAEAGGATAFNRALVGLSKERAVEEGKKRLVVLMNYEDDDFESQGRWEEGCEAPPYSHEAAAWTNDSHRLHVRTQPLIAHRAGGSEKLPHEAKRNAEHAALRGIKGGRVAGVSGKGGGGMGGRADRGKAVNRPRRSASGSSYSDKECGVRERAGRAHSHEKARFRSANRDGDREYGGMGTKEKETTGEETRASERTGRDAELGARKKGVGKSSRMREGEEEERDEYDREEVRGRRGDVGAQ